MALATYKRLALKWQPSQGGDKLFSCIAIVTVVAMLAFGLFLSSIDVPEKPRQTRSAVPERVAKFVTQREKPKPPEPKPQAKPKPKPPEPKPAVDLPKVERKRPVAQPEALTETQQKARDKAATSGILAHLDDLNDLMDTPQVSAQVKGDIRTSAGAQEAAGHDAGSLSAGATRGSGGLDSSRYATQAGSTELGAADVASARAALAANEDALAKTKAKAGSDAGGKTRGNVRSEEGVTLVFDRHKSQLQSLYNRARRSNPGLKGKLILEITILPDGSVASVKVVSSDLNDPSLEARLLARIKTFEFGASDAAVTVNYPVEFLPY